MKKGLSILFYTLVSALSYFSYAGIIAFFSTYFLLGSVIKGQDAIKTLMIFTPIISLVLSIITGISFYLLHKKGLIKVKLLFAIFHLVLSIYFILFIIESANVPIPIYND